MRSHGLVSLGIFAAALALAPGAAQAQDSPAGAPTMEQRLRNVEDQLAIQRLITEYAVRLDAKDLAGYVDLFTENGIWQTGNTQRHGRAEIMQMLQGLYGKTEVEPFGYKGFRMVGNFQVEVDGDHATARSRHVEYERGPKGNPTAILAGLYVDEFERVNGEWKIAHRTDYPVMPTAEEWRAQIAERQAAAKAK